ncbi:MAG: hypothetical protein K0B81_02480 [Candidatus Cloacimonetes bacterium]|nr:hypothetical protein [Candidatus Cloacimonadota bacterium]
MKLEFNVEDIKTLPDGSKEIYLDIKADCQVFIGYLLEGLDGYCYHTIVDTQNDPYQNNCLTNSSHKGKKLMKITTTVDYFSEVESFLRDLQGYEI